MFMKLASNKPVFGVRVKIQGDPTVYFFEDFDRLLGITQQNYIGKKPLLMVQFAHKLEAWLKKENNITGDIQIYADDYHSVNYRPMHRIFDPEKDLTTISLNNLDNYFVKQSWFIPYGKDTLPHDPAMMDVMKSVLGPSMLPVDNNPFRSVE